MDLDKIIGLLTSHRAVEAEKLLRDTLKEENENAEALFLLGVSLHQQAKHEQACEIFSTVCKKAPQHIQAYSAHAGMLFELGRWIEALKVYQQAETLTPDDPSTKANIGIVLEALGKDKEALAYYEKGLVLNPSHAASLLNRGALLARIGCLKDALENNSKLVAAFPEQADAWFNKADVLLALGQFNECIQACQKAIELESGHVKAKFNLAIGLASIGQIKPGQEIVDQLCESNDDRADITAQLIQLGFENFSIKKIIDLRNVYMWAAWQRQIDCNWSDRARLIKDYDNIAAGEIDLNEYMAGQLFPLMSLPVKPETRLFFARKTSDHISQSNYKTVSYFSKFIKKDSNKTIRLGYLSPTFRMHPGAVMIEPVLRLHRRDQFKVYAYSESPSDGSQIRRSIEKSCDVFRDVVDMQDWQIAEIIRDDEIDILIDLEGYNDNSHPAVLAIRAAPLQLRYVGTEMSMGSKFIDYRISDPVTMGEDRKNWDEKIAYLPGCSFMYDNNQLVADTGVCRSDFNLPEDVIVFCCLHNSYKIDPDVFDSWMKILARVEGSVLWLLEKNSSMKENLIRECKVKGINPSRLVFADRVPYEEHLERLTLGDLFLDTFWYNAHTTCLESMYVGLPFLTCQGYAAASRLASSALIACGQNDMVTTSFQEYEDLAVSLAQSPESLAMRRDRILRDAPETLLNTEKSVLNLEEVYLNSWKRYLSEEPPEDFSVNINE